MKTMRILLIEDDTVLGTAVRDQIASDGHSVDWVLRLDEARDAISGTAYDLILLDLMLPDGRGVPFLKDLRSRGDVTPVIILTALDQVSDRIEGLNAGADDYMVKPFDLAELSARIGSVARRYTGNPNPIIVHGPLEVDLAARSIRKDGKPVQLTAREWVLFEAFLQRPGQLLSKGQLEERLYSFDTEVESNTIEVHVSRLRKKLGAGDHRDRKRARLPAGGRVRLPRTLQVRLALGIGLLLTLLWVGVATVTAVMLRHDLDEVFDSALQETAQRILPLAVVDIIGRDEEGVTQHLASIRAHNEHFTYIVRDREGKVLVQSHAADPSIFPAYDGPGFRQTAEYRFYNDAALRDSIRISVAEAAFP